MIKLKHEDNNVKIIEYMKNGKLEKIRYEGNPVKTIKYFKDGNWEIYRDSLKAGHNNRKFLIRKYFEKKINIAIGLANLNKEDKILDFGCGAGALKHKLRSEGYTVTGYDITPDYSDIKDYTAYKPTKIFAMDVFEHMFIEDINLVIKNYKKMSPKFDIVVSIPIEGKIYKTIRKLAGKLSLDPGHITSFKEIKSLLDREFKYIKSKNLINLSYIGVWRWNNSSND